MKRRSLINYLVLGSFGALASPLLSKAQSSGELQLQWLGHTCFLLTVSGLRILVNPFQALGCVVGYQPPRVESDLVLLSSRLLDEGAATEVLGQPKVIFEPGVYDFGGVRFQGVSLDHDREGGRRFGTNIAWSWTMAGIKIIHLGGAAAPINIEQRILMGTPDLLLVPVGGSAKAYNAQEAMETVTTLKPKIVVPTHYLTNAADPNSCELAPVDEFIQLAQSMELNVQLLNDNQTLINLGNVSQTNTTVKVFNDQALMAR